MEIVAAVGSILLLCLFLLMVVSPWIVGIWVYYDAEKQGVNNPVMWLILSFFMPIIVPIVYVLVVRNDQSMKKSTDPETSDTYIREITKSKEQSADPIQRS